MHNKIINLNSIVNLTVMALSQFYNITRDWNKIQGYTSPTDAHIQIPRSINYRYVSIQNSGVRPIAFAITTYANGPIPQIQYVLTGGEVKAVAINSHGEAMQFLHIIDPGTKWEVGHPVPFRSDANNFVLRDGLNKWWVDAFTYPSFSAQH